MKKFLLLFLFTSISFAQNLNDYKYALVPAKFEFQKENDQFKLNTLTKMFMEKYGFTTLLTTDILPVDFASDNCNKVFVDVENKSSMFVTKLKIVLKDCKNNVLFISQEGRSKEKEFKVSYVQALREAFASFDALKHTYNGKQVSSKQEEKVATVATEIPSNKDSNSLYAQPISNGFQLINTEPKVVMKLYKTSVKDFFIAVRDNQNGILFLKDSSWFFEYYKDGKLSSEKIDVTF